MNAGYLFATGAMVIAGIAVAAQAPINARLGGTLGGSMVAAMVSFGVGFAVLLAVTVLRNGLPGGAAMAAAPWWAWVGGFLGAYYVWAATASVPVLGVLTTIAALVLGQVLGGIALDAVGAFGLPMRDIGWQRLLAVMLVASGVLLSMQ